MAWQWFVRLQSSILSVSFSGVLYIIMPTMACQRRPWIALQAYLKVNIDKHCNFSGYFVFPFLLTCMICCSAYFRIILLDIILVLLCVIAIENWDLVQWYLNILRNFLDSTNILNSKISAIIVLTHYLLILPHHGILPPQGNGGNNIFFFKNVDWTCQKFELNLCELVVAFAC